MLQGLKVVVCLEHFLFTHVQASFIVEGGDSYLVRKGKMWLAKLASYRELTRELAGEVTS